MTRKTVLITGASTGIGAACARLMAANGYDIAIGYRSDETAAKSVAADVEKAGGKAVLIRADVGKADDIARMYSEFDAAFPRLDALVNNAGIVAPPARIDEISPERLQQMFAVNLTGAFLVAGQAVTRMSTAKGGHGGGIVNMSSAAARLAAPGNYVDYAASKAAIDLMTKGLALEVAAEGIRVNAIRPGLIETPIHGKGGDPERAQKLAHTVPMQRTGSAEEVADGVLWLLSDQASYVTGTILDISGGR